MVISSLSRHGAASSQGRVGILTVSHGRHCRALRLQSVPAEQCGCVQCAARRHPVQNWRRRRNERCHHCAEGRHHSAVGASSQCSEGVITLRVIILLCGSCHWGIISVLITLPSGCHQRRQHCAEWRHHRAERAEPRHVLSVSYLGRAGGRLCTKLLSTC